MLYAVAFDDLAGLNVIGEDDHLVARGTARSLEDYGRPSSTLLAHPEREPRSVGTGDDVAAAYPKRQFDLLPAPAARYPNQTYLRPCGPDPSAQPEQPHKFAAIESDDDLAVNDCHWGRPIS